MDYFTRIIFRFINVHVTLISRIIHGYGHGYGIHVYSGNDLDAFNFAKTCHREIKVTLKLSTYTVVELTYNLPESSAGCSSSSTTAADGETENVGKTLYLLERFGVSDECYHEMTQLFLELPRSYLVTNERREISQSVELKELPSKYKGAYRPVRKFIEAILSDMVNF